MSRRLYRSAIAFVYTKCPHPPLSFMEYIYALTSLNFPGFD